MYGMSSALPERRCNAPAPLARWLGGLMVGGLICDLLLQERTGGTARDCLGLCGTVQRYIAVLAHTAVSWQPSSSSITLARTSAQRACVCGCVRARVCARTRSYASAARASACVRVRVGGLRVRVGGFCGCVDARVYVCARACACVGTRVRDECGEEVDGEYRCAAHTSEKHVPKLLHAHTCTFTSTHTRTQTHTGALTHTHTLTHTH